MIEKVKLPQPCYSPMLTNKTLAHYLLLGLVMEVSFKIPIQGKTDGSTNKLFINMIKIKNKIKKKF